MVLSNLSSSQLREVTQKADHVREVLTGYKSGSANTAAPGEPRNEYAPELYLGQRYLAKAREVGRSHRTVRRWVAAYLEHGQAAVARAYATSP